MTNNHSRHRLIQRVTLSTITPNRKKIYIISRIEMIIEMKLKRIIIKVTAIRDQLEDEERRIKWLEIDLLKTLEADPEATRTKK